jgi:hypothetical protein
MANQRIDQLNTLTEATIASTDLVPVYDVSTSETKAITKTDFDQSIGEVVDSTFTITDNADSTKKARFQVSGVSTATTRTITLPNADETMVGRATTDTLTNKTIDPSLNTIDGDKLDVTFTPTNYVPTVSGVAQADGVDDLAAHLKGIDNALATSGVVQEFTIPATVSSTLGDFNFVSLSTGNSMRFPAFRVPANFSSLSEFYLVMIPDTTEAISVTVTSDYASSGEVYNTHSETTGALTPSVTLSQITEIDISTCITSIVAGDWVGIQVTSGTTLLRVIGIRFKYISG